MKSLGVDVCIVGAGLAAARHLTRAGRTVAVLEARDQVGGRVFSKALPDSRSDVGRVAGLRSLLCSGRQGTKAVDPKSNKEVETFG